MFVLIACCNLSRVFNKISLHEKTDHFFDLLNGIKSFKNVQLTMQRDSNNVGPPAQKPFAPQNKWNPTLKIGGFSNPGPGASWKPQDNRPPVGNHFQPQTPTFVSDPQPATQSQIDELKAEYKKIRDKTN